LVVFASLLFVRTLTASGPVGIYALVEKVVFEPSERAPERIQVWGSFALVDGGVGRTSATPAQRGYLYFTYPTTAGARGQTLSESIKKEWMDIKAVAGTGQAIGFGNWVYIGPLTSGQIYPTWGGDSANLRVHPDSEKPGSPSIYSTNAGIIKLDQGNHGA